LRSAKRVPATRGTMSVQRRFFQPFDAHHRSRRVPVATALSAGRRNFRSFSPTTLKSDGASMPLFRTNASHCLCFVDRCRTPRSTQTARPGWSPHARGSGLRDNCPRLGRGCDVGFPSSPRTRATDALLSPAIRGLDSATTPRPPGLKAGAIFQRPLPRAKRRLRLRRERDHGDAARFVGADVLVLHRPGGTELAPREEVEALARTDRTPANTSPSKRPLALRWDPSPRAVDVPSR